MRQLVAAVSIALLAACAEVEPDLDTTTAYAFGDDPACLGWKCTGNSPIMGPWGNFTDFRLDGSLPNNVGLWVDGLWKGGVRYQPSIVGAELVGQAGAVVLAGPALEGSYLRITHGTPTDAVYQLRIKKVNHTVQYWVGPPTAIASYELEYTGVGIKDTPLCANPPDSLSGDGQLWQAPLEALLFTGDRYGFDKKITASTYAQSAGWMTIGCAGSAIAKMVLNRFTTVGSTGDYLHPMPGDYQSTRAQRQDVLNMYTGNVCGTGRSFTVPETPITWESSNGWRQRGAQVSWESVWGGGVALCLDTWRLEDSHPGILDDIAAECQVPPRCSDQSWFGGWATRGTVRSANPP